MSENKMIPFIYDEKPFRIMKDGSDMLWVVAKDVCNILEIVNVAQAIDGLDSDEKGISKTYTPGGIQEMLTLSEAGLYTLIIRSNKPQAKPFRRWVTHEVLPSLRKTGAYTHYKTDTNSLPLTEILAIFSRFLAVIESIEQRKGSARTKKQPNQDTPDCEERVIDSSSLYVRDFVSDCCELLPRTWDARTRMFDAYRSWCENVGCQKPLGRNLFLQALSEEITTVKTARISAADGSQPVVFANIRLNPQGNMFADLCKKKEQAGNG